MYVECITIVLIIAVISFIFLRTKRTNYALATLPLLTVPLLHLAGMGVSYLLFKENHMARVATALSFDLLGLLVGALLLGMLLQKLPNKRQRLGFALISAVFMVTLSIVLMINMVVM